MTIREILHKTPVAPLDTELLLSYALKKPREYLLTHPEKRLKNEQISKFNQLSKRRESGEPIAYILGKKEFYGLEFTVSRDVLIPRPETELLVELAIQNILNTRQRRGSLKAAKSQTLDTVIDVGTGSGNIIISIVKNLPAAARKKINFYATDISEKALFAAKKNAKKHGVSKSIKFVKSDLLKFAFRKKLKGNIMIIANLPYVSPEIYKRNKKNLKYEPKKALISEKRGLEYYIRLISEIRKFFNSSFMFQVSCFTEISPEQKNSLLRLIRKELPSAKVKFMKDFSGKTRVAKIDKI